MKILIDSREPPKIQKLAKEILNDIEIQALEFGDIVVEELGLYIERKDISDFINSFKTGHIQQQLINISKFKNPILIISGSYKDMFFKKGFKPKITIYQYLGMLRHIGMKYKVKMFQVENDTQLLHLSKGIIQSLQKNEQFEFFGENHGIQKDLPPLIKVLCLVEGVSIKIATLIYNNYDNLERIKELSHIRKLDIKGIGEKKQEKIYDFLSKL